MNEEFAEFIMNMREAAGWSRDDFAHHLCLSISTVEAYERGEKMPEEPTVFEKHLRAEVKRTIQHKRNIRYKIAV
ncbi:helix-turn-helix protein [compost metagenome]